MTCRIKIELTEIELISLDGKCSPTTQKEIDILKSKIKNRQELKNTSLTQKEMDFIQKVVDIAINNGELVYHNKQIRICNVCNKTAGYAKYTRRTKYHRKGDTNYDKPLSFLGVDFVHRFISFQGYANCGCCNQCFTKIKPILIDKLKGVKAVLPERLMGEPPKYIKHKKMECSKCGWTGHEGEMGKSLTLMGDGYYPSICPNCKATNGIFNTDIKPTDGFVILER